MFNILRALFGKSEPSGTKEDDSFGRLNRLAPLRTAEPADERDSRSFVCREPILNRSERIAGYEFLLHQRLHSRLAGKSSTIRRAYDDALVRNLSSVGVASLLEHRLAFIGISAASFDNPLLSGLPCGNTVLMVDPLENGSFGVERLTDRLLEAKGRGFRIGCRLGAEAGDEAILGLWDFVQISTPGYDGLELADWVRRLHKLHADGRASPPALIAANIENSDDFQLCFRAGFDFFHGPFVVRREDWHPPRGHIDRTRVIQVLNQLRSGAENAELAKNIRQDAMLTYKLLRYINSAANGLQQEITAIDQGLLILGRERFYRWLSLLLFDVQNAGHLERVLIEEALVRANLMERVGCRFPRPGINGDLLFLTGLFSLLDQLLGRPMAEVLADVTVPEIVAQALLSGEGPLAPYLRLAMACESGSQDELAERAMACGADASAVNQDLLAALVWANQVGEAAA
jgi:EAL and modified HD-GYP domain-containing signal transduction protein